MRFLLVGWLIALLAAPSSGAALRRRLVYQLQTWTVDLADRAGL